MPELILSQIQIPYKFQFLRKSKQKLIILLNFIKTFCVAKISKNLMHLLSQAKKQEVGCEALSSYFEFLKILHVVLTNFETIECEKIYVSATRKL